LLEALANGLKKVMSKLGISDVASYRGGQFFQTIGFDDQITQTCLSGTPNLLGKISFASIQQELSRRAHLSSARETELNVLQDYGSVRYRKADNADQHGWAPPVVRAMQAAVGVAPGKSELSSTETAWNSFLDQADSLKPHNVRDLLEFASGTVPLPIEEVESADRIARRFVTSAMSLGSISPEAHRTLSQAMNLLG